ncbi:MAG TPA: glycine--tRNA ligase subunit beta [Terriglobales bacterium]|nr:glycine--tRNA ligase subunit beta [Terriglobales bacterium]
MPDFLLEIGCEEIPARMIDAGAEELQRRVRDLLQRERLSASGIITRFDTPRRLAVIAQDIASSQPDVTETLNGPSVNVAFKDGQPTPAAQAFARKVGVDVTRLARVTTPKGEYVAAEVTRKGRSAREILSENLPKEISAIPWPKNMYWRKPGERYVRPVRWIVAMLDEQVLPLTFADVAAGNFSRGHRLLSDGPVAIPRAGSDYVDVMERVKVLGKDAREKQIRRALDAMTRTVPGARWREDKALLDTVVNLTEFPSVILGSFDPEFLALAEEVLVTVMRDHQKYFAIEDAGGKLKPHFLAVLNVDGDPAGVIRHGHERVLRARFNDARFFWQTDQKISLLNRVKLLKNVTFQKDLGSYYEKTLRVQRLCSWISESVRQGGTAIRPGVVHKAACLAKADLTTELVKEFTELQGIVGGLYARVQPLDEDLPEATRFAIADTIYDQYKPESMDDGVPRSVEGAVLSIGDKADTVAGMFALGLQPTGSKDPFALRRQANGIVKTIAEHKLPISLSVLFMDAYNAYQHGPVRAKFVERGKYKDVVASFFRERLEFYLKDVLGFSYDVVNAVLAGRAGCDNIVDAVTRARDVNAVRVTADFQVIAAAFKRTKNILRQAKEMGRTIPESLLTIPPGAQPEEQRLSQVVSEVLPAFKELVLRRDYAGGLREMAKLRVPLDEFFDKVMVMVDEVNLRDRRLALLNTILFQFSSIADLSEIVTAGSA